MGSDRKTKEKNTKKRTSPSSSSDSQDNRRRKKQRRGDEEESRSKKSDKKSHKHRSDKKKRSNDEHRTRHDKGDNRPKEFIFQKEFRELSEEDYFSKNNEFATWLKEEKNVFFSDLSSESAREMFSNFMKAWNRQKLESRYYEGIVSGPRTAHKWKFKK